jgi:DNA-binding response OmpR family regulator
MSSNPRTHPSRTQQRAALVVDGDRTFRHFAMRVAQQLGCAAVGLRDAEEALRWMAWHEEAPAIVTIDPQLRKMDGFALCQRIRGDVRFTAVPVLFASSRIELEDNVHALDVGADEFLPKPVRSDLYIDTVERWLRGRPREITLEVSLDFHVELAV